MNTLLIALTLFAQMQTPPADAPRTASGLVTVKLADGTDTDHPGPDDIVKIRYSITNAEGKVIDSVSGDHAAVMQVSRMMPGWREAVSMMTAGESRRAWVPSSLGGGKIADGATYMIDTELLDTIHGPETPDDVAAPSADAEITRSGLASRVLKEGNGKRHPTRRSIVKVFYSGWTTEGRLFDSTALHGGQPSEFPLSGVIAGWTEGIPLMVEGEVRRFWIPAKLAYEKDPTKPQGMLVFDIELISIH